MKKVGFVLAATAVSSVLLVSIGCTSKVTEVTTALEDAATNLPSSSSGSSGKSSSGSSGKSSSSSGGSSTSSSSSGGSSTSSSGSTSSSSSSGSTSSSSSSSGSTSSSSSSSSSGGPMTCPDSTPIPASSLPWEPPAPVAAAQCTEADLTAFDAKVPMAASDADLKSAVSATCAACIFGDVTSTTWAPLPEDRSMAAPQLATINIGGCFATMTGNTACGKAIQNLFDCTSAACADCADDASYQTCLQNGAKSGACTAEATAETSACGGIDMTTMTNASNACSPASATYIFDGPIRVACIAKP